MDEGSPLAVHTRRLAAAIGERMPGVPVAHAMRYGGPGIAAAIDELRSRGCARVLVLPLYPQYSTTTTASVADVLDAIGRDAEAPAPRLVDQFPTAPGVIVAHAPCSTAHWQAPGRIEPTIMYCPGLPLLLVNPTPPTSRPT